MTVIKRLLWEYINSKLAQRGKSNENKTNFKNQKIGKRNNS